MLYALLEKTHPIPTLSKLINKHLYKVALCCILPLCFPKNGFFYFDVMYCIREMHVVFVSNLQGDGPAVKDMLEAGILEPYLVKYWGIKLATNAAITVLRVDQVCRKTLMTLKLQSTIFHAQF